jgi:hypothetical protein
MVGANAYHNLEKVAFYLGLSSKECQKDYGSECYRVVARTSKLVDRTIAKFEKDKQDELDKREQSRKKNVVEPSDKGNPGMSLGSMKSNARISKRIGTLGMAEASA